MKLWIDDVRSAPEGYIWCKSVKEAIDLIIYCEASTEWDMIDSDTIELIDLGHDAGEFGPPDYIKLLDWLEETGRSYPIHIHSMNPYGAQRMREICEKNGWKIV